jgi:cyclopropane-fatty-acyl-phospholipid synthase
MVEVLRSTPERAAEVSLGFLDALFREYRPRDFGIRLWDGTTVPADPGVEERFTFVVRRPGALRRMFLRPSELSLGEAYVNGDFEIEGSLEAVFPLADRLLGTPRSRGEQARQAMRLLRLPREAPPHAGQERAHLHGTRHSLERDRQAVTYHYDLSNEFFQLFLDARMVYSCAYFTSEDDDLDTAQERKLDYICRKLRLRPGERLLDVGCGWGALVRHAAERYGVDAVGITLSEAQATLARERIGEASLDDRCRVEVLDYRELDEPSAYDKVVSVGMFEHVGDERLPEYFERAFSLLRPGGAFLNHGIARRPGAWSSRSPTFWERYVFPDGSLTTISAALNAAEETGFEVRDVEGLREHYELTLRHWVRRLEDHADEAWNVADPASYRIWRLYMSAAAYRFQVNRLSVYQALLVRPDGGRSNLPLTRSDWYED